MVALADRIDPDVAAPGLASGYTPGAILVGDERLRQVTDEGHDETHDAGHEGNELAWAAFCYLSRAALTPTSSAAVPSMWPWAKAEWKPKESAVRNLVVAAALVTAEIDRRLLAGEAP